MMTMDPRWEARMASAATWLRECGISFTTGAMAHGINVGDVHVSWFAGDESWAWGRVGIRRYKVYTKDGTQPEFAVFLRRLREGKIKQ